MPPPRLLLSLAALTLPLASHASALTWDASGTNPTSPTDGSGTWSLSAPNWSDGFTDSFYSNNTPATFGKGGSGIAAVSTSGLITAGLLSFNPGANYTLHVDNADRLSLSAGISVAPNVYATNLGTSPASSNQYDVTLTTSQTWSVADSATLEFSARYNHASGKTTLIKTGNGTLIFDGNNGGTGDVSNVVYLLNAGVTRVSFSAGALGFTGNSMSISSGASLEFDTDNLSFGNAGSSVSLSGLGFNGEGAIRAVGPGSHHLASPTNPATFNLLTANTGIGADANASLSFQQILAGPGGLAKVGPGTLILTQLNTYTGGTLVSEGTLVLGNVTAAGTGPVSVSDNTSLQLGDALPAAPKLPALSLSNNSLTPTATLDLNNHKLILQPASAKAATLATLQAQAAYATTHPTGILSTNLPPNFAIAIIDNAVTHLTTFGNTSVDQNSLLLAPELLGDTNIDGKIDLSDLSTVLNHFGQSTPNWTDGNFDHQPTINLTDLSAVLNNFGTTTPNLSSQSPFTN
ncbi:MAG: autotransporter-associated beta strand repeat-containing protein, partial [Phycisphaerae bacterium]